MGHLGLSRDMKLPPEPPQGMDSPWLCHVIPHNRLDDYFTTLISKVTAGVCLREDPHVQLPIGSSRPSCTSGVILPSPRLLEDAGLACQSAGERFIKDFSSEPGRVAILSSPPAASRVRATMTSAEGVEAERSGSGGNTLRECREVQQMHHKEPTLSHTGVD